MSLKVNHPEGKFEQSSECKVPNPGDETECKVDGNQPHGQENSLEQ